MHNREIEIKIKLANAAALMKKVEALGARKKIEDSGLETDLMYDNSTGEFRTGNLAGKHLRLRQAPHGNLLTYKERLDKPDHKHLLQRTEIQTPVSDIDQMDQILKKLGFYVYRKKEKLTSKYVLGGLTLEFHKLPFLGDFLEIEADEVSLEKILPRLGLSLAMGINRGYNKLFYEFCEKKGWSTDTALTFEEEQKRTMDK